MQSLCGLQSVWRNVCVRIVFVLGKNISWWGSNEKRLVPVSTQRMKHLFANWILQITSYVAYFRISTIRSKRDCIGSVSPSVFLCVHFIQDWKTKTNGITKSKWLSDSDQSFNDERTGSAGTAYDVQTVFPYATSAWSNFIVHSFHSYILRNILELFLRV